MNIGRLFPFLLVWLALAFALSSCSRSAGGPSGQAAGTSYRAEIPLADVSSDQGCLSLPKLFQKLHNLNPGRPAVSLPVAISFEGPGAIRDDFRKTIAYGQLAIAREPISDVISLPDVAQDACSSVKVTGPDGVDRSFTVKSSAADSLMAESDDGERLEFTWLSPTSLLLGHRYGVLDQPCSNNDKPVLVTVSKVIDWSDAGVPSMVPATGSAFSIDPQFIAMAAAAVGDDPGSVDLAGANGSKLIDLTKVSAMTAKPVRPDVLSCGGVADPAPSPTPDPGAPGDGRPDHDNHG